MTLRWPSTTFIIMVFAGVINNDPALFSSYRKTGDWPYFRGQKMQQRLGIGPITAKSLKLFEKDEAALPDEGGEQGGRRALKTEMSLGDLAYPLNSSRPFKKRWIEMMKAQETKESSDSHSEDW